MVYYDKYRGLSFITKKCMHKKLYQGFRVTISQKSKLTHTHVIAYTQNYKKHNTTILVQITVINYKQNQFVIVSLRFLIQNKKCLMNKVIHQNKNFDLPYLSLYVCFLSSSLPNVFCLPVFLLLLLKCN